MSTPAGPRDPGLLATGQTERHFTQVLVNTGIAGLATSFTYFSFVFWAYLQTHSVLVTSVLGGSLMGALALLGVPFGTLVDRHHKKRVMVGSAAISSVAFIGAFALFLVVPDDELLDLSRPWFWIFLVLLLGGTVVESLRAIALSTCVTLLVPGPRRSRANGLVGMVTGLTMGVQSVFSGLAVGQLGIRTTMLIGVGLTLLTLLHLLVVRIPEPRLHHDDSVPKAVDLGGAIRAVRAVPGLAALIAFSTLNNLLGGVFASLMDPYGLTLLSVEAWGLLWGALSLAFVVGGAVVARTGLGSRPVRMLLLFNAATWACAAVFTLRESVLLMAVGIFVWLALFPPVEAAEQTILQRVVPLGSQGRVFGLAQAVEMAASPISALLVGPVAHFWLIPYMTEGTGQRDLGWLLGGGEARGIALVFVITGVLGLTISLLALLSGPYRRLSHSYATTAPNDAPEGSQVA